MALLTASTAALLAVSALHGVPSPGMRIYHEAAPGAMTGHAHIAVTVTGLACLQVPPRLLCMVSRPYMLWKKSARMAGLALVRGKCGVGRAGIARLKVGPCPAVRLYPEIISFELGMAL